MHYQHTLKFASKSYFHNFFYVSAILCCFDFYDLEEVFLTFSFPTFNSPRTVQCPVLRQCRCNRHIHSTPYLLSQMLSHQRKLYSVPPVRFHYRRLWRYHIASRAVHSISARQHTVPISNPACNSSLYEKQYITWRTLRKEQCPQSDRYSYGSLRHTLFYIHFWNLYWCSRNRQFRPQLSCVPHLIWIW